MIKINFPLLKLRRTRKGSVLVFALIILSFILVAAFSLSSVALIERRSANSSVNSATAFQNSDKGMEEFLQQLYKELDQNDSLEIMGNELNNVYNTSDYTCNDGIIGPGSSHTARIGTENTKFIITAYKENPNPNPTNPDDNWNVVEIDDCATSLADVSRFRATGNHNNAARAVFLKLRDSLTRGLVAHWSFEDRARNSRIADRPENKNSFMAGDSSKNNYTLTLCQVYDDTDPADVSVEGIDENGDPKTYHLVSFPGCNNPNDTLNGAMNPYKYDDGNCNISDGCTDDGVWREGIVEETDISGVIGVFGNDSTEALYFDGDDYLMALIDDTECHTPSCDSTINYVDDIDAKRLNLENGIAISLWVKPDSTTADGYLVSKYNDGNKSGYELYLDSGNVCFRLNDEVNCATDLTLDDDWHHVIARWREIDGEIEVFVDSEKTGLDEKLNESIDDTLDDELTIGVKSDPIENYFTGMIDDVRIWNRALTDSEICKLCKADTISSASYTCPVANCP